MPGLLMAILAQLEVLKVKMLSWTGLDLLWINTVAGDIFAVVKFLQQVIYLFVRLFV